jgi:hypothetical protein
MIEYTNPNSLYNEIVMLLESGRRVILTEGDVDFDILKLHMHEDASLVKGKGGRECVLKVADRICDRGYVDALFLVDKDFEGVIKHPRTFSANVVPSECHDFVMDLINGHPMLLKVVLEQILSRERRSTKNRVRAEITSEVLIESAVNYALIMSAVRIHSLNRGKGWKFTAPIFSTFGRAIVNVRQIVGKVLQINGQSIDSVNVDAIVEDVERVLNSLSRNKYALVGDHDFFDALAAVCRNEGIQASSKDLSERVVCAIRCDVMFNVFWFSEIERWCHVRGLRGMRCPCNV